MKAFANWEALAPAIERRELIRCHPRSRTGAVERAYAACSRVVDDVDCRPAAGEHACELLAADIRYVAEVREGHGHALALGHVSEGVAVDDAVGVEEAHIE